MESQIGATDLRHNLTDVLQSVREQQATYIVETFGRPQAALISMDEYRAFRHYQQEREALFRQLDEVASANAQFNATLSEADILGLIEQSRVEVAKEQNIAPPED